MEDEQLLLDAWRRGDKLAGGRLVELNYAGLACFFRSKAGDDAPDLIQRTFVILLETQTHMREGASFRSYLFGIARNVLYKFYRGKRRLKDRFEPETTSAVDLGPTPSALFADVQETRLLLQAMRRIPVESQIILELYYWEQMSASEVADVLEVPEGTARTRIRRAKQLLQEQLAELAQSPRLFQSTISDLDSWAANLRVSLKPRA